MPNSFPSTGSPTSSTTTPADEITAIRRRLGDTGTVSRLTDAQIDDAFQSAVERYSNDRPDQTTVDLTGAGSSFFAVSDMTGFLVDWSVLLSIEYPAGDPSSADYDPTFLRPATDWETFRDEGTSYLRLKHHSPSASQVVRTTFTIPRVWTLSSVTVLEPDRHAVRALATSYACDVLADMAADDLDTLIPTDQVDYASVSERWRRQSKAWRERYDAHVGATTAGAGKDAGPRAAVIRRNWDTSSRSGSWLTHRNRT